MATRKGVLITATTFPRYSGDTVPTFVLELARNLAKEGHPVRVLAPRHRGAALHETVDGVEVTRFRYAPQFLEKLAYGNGILPNIKNNPFLIALLPGFLLAQLAATIGIVRRERTTCLNAHWIFPQGLIAVAVKIFRPGIRFVCTVHGGDIFALSRLLPFRPLLKLVLKKADAVTANSSFTRDAILRICPSAHVVIVPMGVDTGRFSPKPEESIPSGGKSDLTILYCGRLALKKGVRYLIDAMTLLAGRFPTARLLVVGDGEERERLIEQTERSGLEERISFLGAIPNEKLPELFRRSDLVIYPSIVDERGDTEGLGVVLLEAGAAGKPVVASRTGGIPDVIAEGETGLLVEEKNPRQLADAISELLGNPEKRHDMGRKARDRIEALFSWPSVSRRFSKIFEN